MQRRAFVLFLLAAALVLGGSCKSSTGPVDEEGFVGTWRATKAEFVSLADPNTKADIVAQGSTVTLAFDETTAVLTITAPGENPQILNATWSASVDVLTLTWTSGANGEAQFDYVLSGDNLSMDGGHMPFDFTPGNPEEAILSLILVRQ
jgi:hypothetical protein